MYDHQGLQDVFFMMLYGGAAMLAVVSCLYLTLTRGNMFFATINPPKTLRRWAAAFLAAVAASHVWWGVLGICCLKDDRLTRNIIAITLDRLTLVPLMMIVLLRMLQDRRRHLWPIFAVILPLVVISVISIATHNNSFERYTMIYSIVIGIVFTLYYIHAVRHYSHWLRDNFADLQHKEVWQSLLLLASILFVYAAYASNEGDLAAEYLSQINTLFIIGFVLWRVETLQQLDITEEEEEESIAAETLKESPSSNSICSMTSPYLSWLPLSAPTALILVPTLPSKTLLTTPISTTCASITSCDFIARLPIRHPRCQPRCLPNKAASTAISPSVQLSRSLLDRR